MESIILASSSPRRTMLLTQLGIDHEVMEPNIDENAFMAETMEDLVMQLAKSKAMEVALRVNKGIVIGADTIVVFGGEIFGKPKDEAHALSMLRKLQNSTHQVYTGIAAIEVKTREIKTGFRKVDVAMAPCTEERLLAYIATGEPMDKAGAYSIQGKGAPLIKEIHGDYYAVVGLPLELTVELLAEFDVVAPLFFQ